MNTEASQNQGDVLAGIHSGRLFLGSCMSLVSTAVVFGVVTSLMGDLKAEFGLTNTEAGWIGGATIWGFTISIFIFGPLCNVIGMGRLLRFSMLCHLVGPLLMIFAGQSAGSVIVQWTLSTWMVKRHGQAGSASTTCCS